MPNIASNIPASTSRKFNQADYKSAPDWFTGRFLSNLNLFTDPVYSALSNGLTFQQNFKCQVYTANITGALAATSGATVTPVAFSTPLTSPIGVLLVKINLTGNLTAPVVSPINFSWYLNGTTMTISVGGLTPSSVYTMTFLVF